MKNEINKKLMEKKTKIPTLRMLTFNTKDFRSLEIDSL